MAGGSIDTGGSVPPTRTPNRRLLALNHFANPVDAPGGTRLVELTSRLEGWDTTIVAAGRNLFTRRRTGPSRRPPGAPDRAAGEPGGHPGREPDYRTVWTTPYASNGWARIANWVSYAVAAFVLGLRLGRPDVVYASSPHLLTGLSGWALARRYRVPFVLEIRDLWPQVLVDTGRLDPDSLLYRVVHRLEHFLYRRADTIVALTEGSAQVIIDSGIDRAKVTVIPNGADPAAMVPSASREELRRRYGFDDLTIVYAGAHGPANGLDFVLDAAAELEAEHVEVTFVLVGDGLVKPALTRRAAEERIGSVRFLEPVPKNEIPDLLAAADVGLHVLADLPLFLYGVSPNKLFDYMAAGLPVLTNTGGEVGDLVKANDAGVAVAPAEIASGVRQLIGAGAERRREWGRNGQAFMAAHRSRTEMAARLQAVLDRAG